MGNSTSRYGMDFKADTQRSTYRWVIWFNNGKSIYGYSRQEGKPEIQDKAKLLMRKIIMLTKSDKNYFDAKNVKCIEIYKRTSLGMYQEHLVDLCPTQYVLKGNILFNSHQSMIEFLNTVYDLIRLGNIGQLSYSMVGYSKITEDQLFDTSRAFKDIADLQKYCNNLLIDGLPVGRIEAYRNKILDKFSSISFKTA